MAHEGFVHWNLRRTALDGSPHPLLVSPLCHGDPSLGCHPALPSQSPASENPGLQDCPPFGPTGTIPRQWTASRRNRRTRIASNFGSLLSLASRRASRGIGRSSSRCGGRDWQRDRSGVPHSFEGGPTMEGFPRQHPYFRALGCSDLSRNMDPRRSTGLRDHPVLPRTAGALESSKTPGSGCSRYSCVA